MPIVRDSFYINGQWVKAKSSETLSVTTSGTGELYATIPAGTVEEANLAVEAAAAAFTGDIVGLAVGVELELELRAFGGLAKR